MRVSKTIALALLHIAAGFSSKPTGVKTVYIVRHGEKISGNMANGELQHEAQCLSEKGWARSYNLKSVFGKGAAEYNGLRTPEAIFSCNYGEPLDCRDRNGMFRTQQLVAALADSLNITVDNSTGFVPTLCGMVWNEDSKAGYLEHKIGTDDDPKQPEVYRTMMKQWVADQPNCVGDECKGVPSCHTRGFGKPTADGDYETEMADGRCCNQDAADKIKAKLQEVDVVLAGWEHANINYLAAALADQSYEEFQKTLADGNAGQWDGSDYDRIYEMHFDRETLKYLHGSYMKQQGFDYPLDAGYSGWKAYLGPQTYCGAVDESSIPNSKQGTDYPVIFPGPPFGRAQPVPGSPTFGKVDTNVCTSETPNCLN